MLLFLSKKIIKNKWMIISLLMGNILLAGIVSGIPLYAQATMQRLLMKQTDRFYQDREIYPGLMTLTSKLAQTKGATAESQFTFLQKLAYEELPVTFGLPSLVTREQISVNCVVRPVVEVKEGNNSITCQLTSFAAFDNHSRIVLGRSLNPNPEGNVIEAVVSRRTYDNMNVVLNEDYQTVYLEVNDETITIKVVGVFESIDESDIYWSYSPNSMASAFVIDHGLSRRMFIDNTNADITCTWQVNLDCGRLNIRDVPLYLSAARRYHDELNTQFSKTYTEHFTAILSDFMEKSQKLNVTLWVLQAPIFIFLAFFIFMVSKQILSLDRNDISVLKSRGASRGKILLIYFLQGLFVSAISAVLGLLLGIFICRVTGASNGFLNFIGRTGLDVKVNVEAFLYIGAACVLSMLTMILPVFQYAKVNIVDLKQERAAKKKSLWQTFFLDVLALGVSCYGLYSFHTRQEFFAQNTESLQSIDPLMFLTSSLFVIGLGLLCLRLFPYLVRLLLKVFMKFISPSLYASLLRVARTMGQEQFIMIFLMFTLAVGIFNAKIARTINQNMEDKVKYSSAADIRLKEVWRDNSTMDMQGGRTEATLFYEPDFAKYTLMPEVEAAAKVLAERATVNLPSAAGKIDNVQLMGVQTDDFGKVIWYRGDLLPIHINNYLNSLSRTPRAILLSSNFAEFYKIGDVVNYRCGRGANSGVVYGFVDYWPGYNSYERSKASDGQIKERENWLIVANLGFLQANWGLTPYEVWLRTNTDSNNFLTVYANEKNIKFASFSDAKAAVTENRNDPVLQGTNGALTVDFIVTLLVCATGFLIYWILSIKSRVLQFGVFRAMGLSMGGIFNILVNEQLLISGISICLGIAIGEVSSRLFVPIIQIAYTASEKVIPLIVITNTSDYTRLMVFVGAMIVLCITILVIIASKIRIAAALKLGED